MVSRDRKALIPRGPTSTGRAQKNPSRGMRRGRRTEPALLIFAGFHPLFGRGSCRIWHLVVELPVQPVAVASSGRIPLPLWMSVLGNPKTWIEWRDAPPGCQRVFPSFHPARTVRPGNPAHVRWVPLCSMALGATAPTSPHGRLFTDHPGPSKGSQQVEPLVGAPGDAGHCITHPGSHASWPSTVLSPGWPSPGWPGRAPGTSGRPAG